MQHFLCVLRRPSRHHFRLKSIKHESNIFMSVQWLINVNPRVSTIWDDLSLPVCWVKTTEASSAVEAPPSAPIPSSSSSTKSAFSRSISPMSSANTSGVEERHKSCNLSPSPDDAGSGRWNVCFFYTRLSGVEETHISPASIIWCRETYISSGSTSGAEKSQKTCNLPASSGVEETHISSLKIICCKRNTHISSVSIIWCRRNAHFICQHHLFLTVIHHKCIIYMKLVQYN